MRDEERETGERGGGVTLQLSPFNRHSSRWALMFHSRVCDNAQRCCESRWTAEHGQKLSLLIFHPLPARTMSVLRATPPFRPQPDGVELMGQDSEVWTSELEESPRRTTTPLSHDPTHPEDLQPIREEQMDPEVENEVQVCLCVCE